MPIPNNMLPFIKAIQVPSEPGHYLVITSDLEFVHVEAKFIEDEFQGFISKARGPVREAEILMFAPIKSPSEIVKNIYQNANCPRMALHHG